MNTLYLSEIETPIGLMTACANESGICLAEFSDQETLDSDIDSLMIPYLWY